MARKVLRWVSLAFWAVAIVTAIGLMVAHPQWAIRICYAALVAGLLFSWLFVSDENLFREGENNG